MFPSLPTPVLTELFFPKPLTIILTCIRSKRRKKSTEKKFALTGYEPISSDYESDKLCNEQKRILVEPGIEPATSIHKGALAFKPLRIQYTLKR